MFRSLNRSSFSSFTSTLVRSRAGLIAGSLAVAASAVPLMGAGPWEWHRRPGECEEVVRREYRPEYRPDRQEYRPVIIERITEVEPCGVSFNAYQSGDTVMIFASGTNRTGGFITSLGALDTFGRKVTLKLCNIAPQACVTQAITPFSINAAIHADCELSTIDIVVGGRQVCVPVCRVARIG